MPEHAKAIAFYDHPFFGKWPAITENSFGSGTLLYEGTYLSDALQNGGASGCAAESRADRTGSAVARIRARPARREPNGQAGPLLLQLLGGEVKPNYAYARGNEPAGRQVGGEGGGADARAVGSGDRGGVGLGKSPLRDDGMIGG